LIKLIELLMILLLVPLGASGVIWTIGWQATIKVRLEHTREQFKLNEDAKLNAIEIDERKTQLALTQAEAVQSYNGTYQDASVSHRSRLK
jgi:hypothetical protein